MPRAFPLLPLTEKQLGKGSTCQGEGPPWSSVELRCEATTDMQSNVHTFVHSFGIFLAASRIPGQVIKYSWDNSGESEILCPGQGRYSFLAEAAHAHIK